MSACPYCDTTPELGHDDIGMPHYDCNSCEMYAEGFSEAEAAADWEDQVLALEGPEPACVARAREWS